ncbi:hypothetical protein FNF29_04208 [Cafeteria roenbergensis]|uniref:Uncharacterized protein n=1 Tax=Cafeteria roenbergensis TaxID=33653 RepID=A0A5A8CHX8_CAFRO|nr:hypothetical protein FNF29_04208 [Cafeteria roenbergensis]|eukprot:KAA0152094.1 hypothetical protein FNF29_04208 [Cafeteria roenbergensis]
MADSSAERDPASGSAADAGTPTLGTPEGEGLAETDVANWMREQLATEVGRLAKLGAKVITMQVKNCCVVREELTEAEIAAEAAAASSGAGADGGAAATKPAGKSKRRRGGRRRKGAAAKAALAKADEEAAAAAEAAALAPAPASGDGAAAAGETAAEGTEEASAGAGDKDDAAEVGAAGGGAEGAEAADEEPADEEPADEEAEVAAPAGPSRLVNRLEVDATFDFDLVNQLLVSPPVDCPVKEGYKLVTLVLLEKRAATPRLLSYLYQADMPGHSLDRWIFINRELKESYHVVSFE